MATEHTCQLCRSAFEIGDDDRAFYAKVGVPEPTFCPQCRFQRRLTWRNERSLYRIPCAATGKQVISMFSPESGITVYDRDYWWGDGWDQLASGMEYDFSRPFFEQYRELLRRAPLPNLANTNVVQTEYANHCADCKSCYLTYASYQNEHVLYSSGLVDCKDSLDLFIGNKVHDSYDLSFCATSSNLRYSYDSDDCVDANFLDTCVNLMSCTACVNLRNKQHCMWNEQLTREEYAAKLAALDLGSYAKLSAFQEQLAAFVARFPRRHASNLRAVNATGDYIMDAKNLTACFEIYGNAEDCKYMSHGMEMRDSYDGFGAGANAELLYEVVDSGLNGARYFATVYAHTNEDIRYAYCCHNSKDLFGCIGLRNQRYCILNKQYTKEEYEALLPKIIEHMNAMPYVDAGGRTYRYGEFFPQEVSPFAYNETIAQEYVPLTEAAATSLGFTWRAAEARSYAITKTAADLPDHIRDAPDTITEDTIGCEHGGLCVHQCTTAFRIIPEELAFYRKHQIPLPRLCPNCRHYSRIAKRTAFQLWSATCSCAGAASSDGAYTNAAPHAHGDSPCTGSFSTAHNPAKQLIVYCEACYNAEVA